MKKIDTQFTIVKESEPEYISGDISGNGEIDLYDTIEICKIIMEMRIFNDEEKTIADYNGDGVVGLYDAIEIAKKLLEKNSINYCSYIKNTPPGEHTIIQSASSMGFMMLRRQLKMGKRWYLIKIIHKNSFLQ